MCSWELRLVRELPDSTSSITARGDAGPLNWRPGPRGTGPRRRSARRPRMMICLTRGYRLWRRLMCPDVTLLTTDDDDAR